jgi:hypothetical protein
MPTYRGLVHSINALSGSHHWQWVVTTPLSELTGVICGDEHLTTGAAQDAIDRWRSKKS